MNELNIKKEGEARGCEICHQTDCFNPTTKECFRCVYIIKPKKNNYIKNSIFLSFLYLKTIKLVLRMS